MIRASFLVSLALLACSSSSVNDGQGADGGSGGTSGDAGSMGGSSTGGSSTGGQAGSALGGAAGASGSPSVCSGTPLDCVTCCATNQPGGYSEFLDEFKASQCQGQACSGTCTEVCFGAPPTVTESCADCFWVPEPDIHTTVKLACQLATRDKCQVFAECLESCELE